MADNQIGIKFTGDATQLTASVNDANKALARVGNGSRQAQTALTNLSRVASDAPFGFIAIQNNLDQLVQSFGQTGVSAKTLATALIGPAGIALAFSTVSALVTAGIQKYGSLNAALQVTFNELSKAQLAQRDLNKALIEGEGAARAEISTITALLSVAKDKTLSDQARQQAIDKLNKDYDKYLPKLTQENIETQNVTAAVDKLNASLIKQAKIKGIQELITKEYQKQAELLNSTASDNLGFFDQLKNAALSAGNTVLQAQLNTVQGVKNQFQGVKDTEERIKQFESVLKRLLADEANDGTLFANNVEKAARKVKEKVKEVAISASTIFSKIDLTKPIEEATSRFTGANLFGKQKGLFFFEQLKFETELAKERFDSLQQKAETLSNVLTSTLGNAFENLFTDILNGSQNAFAGFARAIAAVIKRLIAAAVTAAIFSAIISSATGGFGAAAAGGGFLNNFKGLFSQLSGIPKFASGGIVTGPTLGLVGEAGREAIIPLDRIGEVLGSIGGAQSVVVSGRIRGRDIYITNQQEGVSAGRLL